MKRLIFALGLVPVIATAYGSRLDFSYNFDGAPSEGYGTGKAETYDVAVRLDNPSLIGAKICGIRVAVPSEGVVDASVWLSSDLKLSKKNGKNVNDPDISAVDCDITDGWLDMAFDTPYAIPSDGVYVGYSFTVDGLDADTEAPVAVAEGSNPDGLYLHTSRTKLRWGSMSEELGKVSAMAVTLEGSFPEKSAIFTVGNVKAAANEAIAVPLEIVNCGTGEVSSVEYSGYVSDLSFSGTAVLDKPVAGHIGSTGTAYVDIIPVDAPGEYPLRIKVTGINGTDVDCPEAEGTLKVYPFLPVNRPLVEEYTGLWCGWCPRGYVALETMKERKGRLFIAVAYHNGDDMSFGGETPNYPSGYPAAYINRSVSIDLRDIYTGWDDYRTYIPDGGVDVAVDWVDGSHKAVKATATARFTDSHSGADYRFSYILVADGLSNPEWRQHNSYSGRTDMASDMPGQWGEVFIDGPEYVEGLTFNDVAVAATDFDGERGSIPTDIDAGEEYVHSHVFELGDISEAVLTAPEKLRVVAVLTDGRSGKFINCNSSPLINGDPFADFSSADEIRVHETVYETARWTLDGRRIGIPVRGINIVRYSDGSVRKELVN